MSKMQTAAEAARENLKNAEEYLKTMIEARKDAEYREKIARNLRNEADAALVRAEAMEALQQERSK